MSPREMAFKADVEAWEAAEGPMSDDEFASFKEKWKQTHPKAGGGAGGAGVGVGGAPEKPSSLADMMKGAARDAVMTVNKAGNEVLGPIAPFSDAQADLAESIDNGVSNVRQGARNIGDWLSRAYHKVAGDDQQKLLPEFGGKSPEVEELDMSVPANKAYVKHLRDQQLRNDEEDVRRRVEEGNPVGDAVQAFARRQPVSQVQEIDMTTPEGRAIVEFYRKQSEAPARLGSKENPLRLPPIDL